MARVWIEQCGRNLAPRRALGGAIESAELQREVRAPVLCELKAAYRRSGAQSGESALEPSDGVLTRGDAIIARNNEAVPRGASDKPELMRTVWIVEENVTPVTCGYIGEDRCQIVGVDRLRRNCFR